MWLPLNTLVLVTVSVMGQSSEELIELPDIIVSDAPTVAIGQGTVVGSLSEDGSYSQFYGIPYADATSGKNRFKAPNSPPAFQDTFIANRRDIKCVHATATGYDGTEDCLVANVFTKTLDSTSQQPVMVWVKGKEFDKTYKNEPSFANFVEKDVVVVSINFRESVLGFLCLGTEIAPGNAGLKDIIAGLRWVQENIAQFGGNPNDITLVGHGSGAAAVDLVTLSPMSNGLVHKAISQSGNALSPWAVTRDNLEYALQVAEALGHVITNIEDLSEIFQRTSVTALMAVINELDLTDNSLAFSPCLEKENLEGVEPFMVKSPQQVLNDRDFLAIPFLTGFVDNEGTIRSHEAVDRNWMDKMSESFTDFLQPDLKFDNNEQLTQTADSIRSFYFQNDPIDLEHAENYITYHGHTMILVSAIREVRMRALASTEPVYLYQFSYKGSLGEPLVGPLEVESAAHSEELAYMFYDPNDSSISQRDLAIGDILVERWTNFVKVGQPLSEISSVFWRPFSAVSSSYLRILDNDEINEQATFEVQLQNPHPTEITFWDEIYAEHFLDAEGKWEWTERNEDEEDGSGEESEGGDEGNGETDGGNGDGDGDAGNGDGDGDGGTDGGDGGTDNGGGDENDGNSASSAVGYTFSIIALFAILNQIHTSQIMS